METEAAVRALIIAARRAGVSVVRLRTGAPAEERASPLAGTIYPIDLDNPGVSLHWNLLTAATPRTPAPSDVRLALHCALRDHVPLLGAALAQMGLVARSSGAGWSLLLDAARLATIRYYQGWLISGDSVIRPPNLRTIYGLLADPSNLLALAVGDAPIKAASAGGAREALDAVRARLDAQPTAVFRQVAAGLCDRLAPLALHPRLAPWWTTPLTAPGTVLDHTPGILVDVRLPPGDDESAALAAHRYGIYLLTCVIALAQIRRTVGVDRPPILLVLEEGSAWWRGALLGDHLTTLAEAGIAVLTTSARLPPEPIGARLLAGVATWWIHTINPVDGARLQPHLQSWGIPGDLLLTRLPGVALLKLPGADGPVVATVRPPTGGEGA
jgi:hypothetical protein